MNKIAKVEGHDSLVRDMSSHAIVNNNDAGYDAYIRSRERARQQAKIMQQHSEELNNLKSDMQEIKQMLSILIKGKQ